MLKELMEKINGALELVWSHLHHTEFEIDKMALIYTTRTSKQDPQHGGKTIPTL